MLLDWTADIEPWLKALDGGQKDSTIFEKNFRLHVMLPREEGFAIDRLL